MRLNRHTRQRNQPLCLLEPIDPNRFVADEDSPEAPDTIEKVKHALQTRILADDSVWLFKLKALEGGYGYGIALLRRGQVIDAWMPYEP